MPKTEGRSEYRGPQGPIPEIGPEDIDDIVEHAAASKEGPTQEGGAEKKEFDFISAQSLPELYQMIRDQEIITNSNEQEYKAEQIIVLIRNGVLKYITNRGNLRTTIERLFENFASAGDREDVYAILRYRGTIHGKLRTYTAKEIIDLIEAGEIDKIPRTDGLRAKLLEFN